MKHLEKFVIVIAFGSLLALQFMALHAVEDRNEYLEARLAATENDVRVLSKEANDRDEHLRQFLQDLVGSLEGSLQEQRQAVTALGDKIGTVEQEFADKLVLTTNDFTTLVDDFLDAVVSVHTDSGSGSGVLVHPNGYIVTNYHVIDETDLGYVKTHSRKQYVYRVLAKNEVQDLALLKLDEQRTFDWLPIAESDTVKVGTRIVALGSPLGFDFTVTEGIVSAVNRLNTDGVQFVQIDVPVNPGNSGGPVVNIKGEIVGITNMKIKGSEGIGFAIEADEVSDFVAGHLPEP